MLDNLRTGKRERATPVVDPGEYRPIMAVGHWIVYVMNNTVRATDALTAKTHVLGKALAFARPPRPGTSCAAAITVSAC